MKVKYLGKATDNQIKWGANDDSRPILQINKTYTLKEKRIHSWHTKYILEEFPNKKFNSVHFEEVED